MIAPATWVIWGQNGFLLQERYGAKFNLDKTKDVRISFTLELCCSKTLQLHTYQKTIIQDFTRFCLLIIEDFSNAYQFVELGIGPFFQIWRKNDFLDLMVARFFHICLVRNLTSSESRECARWLVKVLGSVVPPGNLLAGHPVKGL